MSQHSVIRLHTFCLFLAVVSGLLAWMLVGDRKVMGQAINSTSNQELPVLELNHPVKRELNVGQAHGFRLDLKAGQFVKIEVEQQGIDVVVRLNSPDGVGPVQVDRQPWTQGKEEILWEAVVTGTFRVEVFAPRAIQAGNYVIRRIDLSQPSEQERALVKASRLCAQAINHLQNRKYDEGIKLAEESLAMRESLLPPDDTDIAESLYWLIDLLENRGSLNDYERISQMYARVLQIRESAFGPDHPHVARLLNAIANGSELLRAVELFERGLTILEKSYGPNHPDVGLLLSNYAIKLDSKGEYERAEAMYKRAVDISEKAGQGDILAQNLNNLGDFYLVRDDYEHAEPLLQRALAIWTDVHGRENDRTTFAIGNLGDLYRRKGDFARAEPLAKEALEILQKVTGSNSHMVGGAHHGLGLLYLSMGDYWRAEQSLQRSQTILEPFSTHVNNMFSVLLRTRVRLALAMKKNDEAVAYLRRVAEISESGLHNVMAFGSGEDKLNFLKIFDEETNETLSLQARFAPKDVQALNLAFTTWLQRKGRVLDEMNRSIGLLRRAAGSESASLFNEWATKLSERSRLMTTEWDPQNRNVHQAKIKQLDFEIRHLESTISSRSVEFRTQVLPPVMAEDVRAALPPETALIEFAQYQPVDPRTNKKSPARYLAYVLPKEGVLRWVELGEVANIDAAVRTLRQTIDDKGFRIDPIPVARKLDQLVMRPIRPLLGKAKTVFLSPDGELNLAPFAAFRDEHGQYLIENYLFIYLTSGRDLLRLKIKHQSQQEKLIFAISDFDRTVEQPIATSMVAIPSQTVSDSRGGVLSSDSTMATITFKPLGYARDEGVAIQRLFSGAKLYEGGQATETLLKQVRRPYFLHLATHGFFLPNDKQNKENSLLRSGLVFAGANQRKSGNDDGFLTAFEAAALDLWGTKLVVLSACDTGNGQVKTGEGVFGLRRALVLAGAETQVVSLWLANDKATQRLMRSFYSNLKANMGRAEALRQAQLKMLKDGVFPNPYYWANFVCVGEWSPLDQ